MKSSSVPPSPLRVLLGPPIAFHRCLAQVSGSITAGLMLSQAIYWSPRTDDPEGWFYKTRDQWEAETTLKRWDQESARRTLVSKGLIQEKKVGMPARLYYRVNFGKLEDSLADMLVVSPPTGRSVRRQQKGHSTANTTAVPPPTYTESTSETTAETTAERNTVPPDGGATERPPRKVPETVWHQTIAAIKAAYEEANPGVKAPWGPLAFVRLKVAMEGCVDWGLEEWQKCISNRFASDSINAGEPPVVFIPYLNRYLAGPLDQFKHPKEGSNGRYVPSARTARNRAAVDIVSAAIDRGEV